jgi:outer membrane protein TolC
MARYEAGAVTQLDVTEAQQDAFDAQAARIKADTDLVYSRVLLRVVAGKPPKVRASTSPAVPAPNVPTELGQNPGTSSPAPTSPAPAPAP